MTITIQGNSLSDIKRQLAIETPTFAVTFDPFWEADIGKISGIVEWGDEKHRFPDLETLTAHVAGLFELFKKERERRVAQSRQEGLRQQ